MRIDELREKESIDDTSRSKKWRVLVDLSAFVSKKRVLNSSLFNIIEFLHIITFVSVFKVLL
jgi:hypothetical protein